ncbi:MAG: hypothetical protein CMH28_00825 [Micavibrio sp.]|nr:hypothetical protein [Micavibrio sp.]|tara:strand:+ start:244 stop:426 length:183 start_codon:yes stop_codon:yes gene_type:complete
MKQFYSKHKKKIIIVAICFLLLIACYLLLKNNFPNENQVKKDFIKRNIEQEREYWHGRKF